MVSQDNKTPELDYYSKTWANIREKLTEELDGLRKNNDEVKSRDQTNYTRGKIAQIKHILNWEKAAFDMEKKSKLLI